MKASHAVVVICAASVLASACVNDPEQTRIHGPVDTAVTNTGDRPASGVYAGGGVYQLTGVRISSAACRIDVKGSLDELLAIVNPLDPKSFQGDTTEVPVDAPQVEAVRAFVSSLELRVSETGSTMAIGTADDVSQSLPWVGRVTGGAKDTLRTTAVIQTIEERAIEMRLTSPETPPDQPAPSSIDANLTFNWVELPLLPTWLVHVEEGAGKCSAEGSATVVRTGPTPATPPPPTGPAAVLSISPAPGPGSPLEPAVSLLSTLVWNPPTKPDDKTLTMSQGEGGRGAGVGILSENGGGYAVYIDGDLDGVQFRIKGWKVDATGVSGSLLAGTGDSVAIASVHLAG
ncbi:MAG: hypothetical protein K1X95_00165 [Acidimicrobiia bacterium]|nr:hypothetical protein [Acidimicrobiia bacterium]